ncbi:MAG: Glu-tRNA(Gln) amidotransferase subunit GatE [Candidatus Woesearchaeota archaeon]
MTAKTPQLKTTITEDDIKELKFTCGLEIHQQLEGRKLFCHCPTTIRDDQPDFEVKRLLRASAGESGRVDKAAAAETRKKKHYIYQGYNDTTCLVELDEEPPHEVSEKALGSALSLSKLFSMNIADQVRFMRKTVVDGSNTSGFQRTAMVSANGKLKTANDNEIGVETICLEEDSAKAITATEESKTYNLSRLGIPLIEIATAPDIHHPDIVKEVAEHIGMALRSLDTVKRGLGTIRQDVNISIEKGVRVEIKGAQDLKMLPTLARNEMLRQHNMLLIFKELENRKANANNPIIDITDTVKNSSSKVVQSALKKENGAILAVKLEGYKGVTGLEVQSGRRYGSELSDHAKVMGVKGLFHADELPNYGITEDEKQAIFKALDANPETDNFLLIAAEKKTARRAMEAAKEAAKTLKLERCVRQARPDGTTQYLRPMPGAARMYPETDVEPIMIDKDTIEVPELLSEKVKRLQDKFNLSEEMTKRLLKDGIDIERLTETYPNVKPSIIIDLYYSLPAQLKKKEGLDIDMSQHDKDILTRLNDNLIAKESLPEILKLLAKGKKVDYTEFKPMTLKDIKDDVKRIVEEMDGAPTGAIIGKIMGKYKGKVDGKELSEYVKSLLD